jgi:flagellar protein FliO/FliZ
MLPSLASLASLLTAGAALAGVIALILGAQLAVRRYGPAARRATAQSGRLLAIEERLAIDPRRRLLLVRCGERRVLLLTGGAQDVTIGWLP